MNSMRYAAFAQQYQRPALIRSDELKQHISEHTDLDLLTRQHPGSGVFLKVKKPLHVFKKVIYVEKLIGQNFTFAIVNLIIPVDSMIYMDDACFSSYSSARKMRASHAVVHSIVSMLTGEAVPQGQSHYDPCFKYKPDSAIEIKNFSMEDETCAEGIHFFMNITDALEYVL